MIRRPLAEATGLIMSVRRVKLLVVLIILIILLSHNTFAGWLIGIQGGQSIYNGTLITNDAGTKLMTNDAGTILAVPDP